MINSKTERDSLSESQKDRQTEREKERERGNFPLFLCAACNSNTAGIIANNREYDETLQNITELFCYFLIFFVLKYQTTYNIK